MTPDLPIVAVLDAAAKALADHACLVLEAPPGAGKSTLLPLHLLKQPFAQTGRILMLEPRRLAARAVAARLAANLGEAPGGTVGYRIRNDSKQSKDTRLLVVTEGILNRMIQDAPDLPGIAAVIFDEFHERSLDADLGLALAREAQQGLRPDLKLLVMSATLDGDRVAALLGDAPVIRAEGRMFPVETRHRPLGPTERIEDATARAVREALADEPGSILVFLPGAAEIKRVAERLSGLPGATDLYPLYGDLGQGEQDRAIAPSPSGRRKVVLATAIAETSLTIDGVRVVVDAGQMRLPRFDPAAGMSRLVTARVSAAAAEQRRGRAGRLSPGVCIRLWPEAEQRGLVPYSPPEIVSADLAPLALDLARWGAPDGAGLAFLDPPPAAALAQARDLLTLLGALDGDGRLTGHGKAMAQVPAHPRLAHLLLAGRERGMGGMACRLAALLGERDILRFTGGAPREADLSWRLDLLREGARESLPHGVALDRGTLARAREQAGAFRRQLGLKPGEDESGDAGLLLALAYPDRIGLRRPDGEGGYLMSGGRGAALPPGDPLGGHDVLAIGEIDGGGAMGGGGQNARIFLAAPLARETLEQEFSDRIETGDSVRWDRREQRIEARRLRRLGALTLASQRLSDPPPEAVADAWRQGLSQLDWPWDDGARALRARLAFLHRIEPESWPAMDDAALLADAGDWLLPRLAGLTRWTQVTPALLSEALRERFDWNARQALDRLAPQRLTVPSGQDRPIEYDGDPPALRVKLQEMFGATETPRIAGGRVPLVLHLLSPAGRPLAVTGDLASFWRGPYQDVRRQMRGEYPKHPWPEDPLAAAPTHRTKKASGQG